MVYDSFETLRVAVDDGVAWLRLLRSACRRHASRGAASTTSGGRWPGSDPRSGTPMKH
jgi:hypothetical protein